MSPKSPKKSPKRGPADPPDSKRGKVERKVIVQFQGPDGEPVGGQLEVPLGSSREQLEALLQQLQGEECPYSLHVGKAQVEVTGTVLEAVEKLEEAEKSSEAVLPISFFPMAVFRVRPVTRCSSSMPGHSEAVLCCAFSPDSTYLATGSGDTTVRLWDLQTELPWKELKGHSGWVLQVAWSADASRLASAGMDKTPILWDPATGKKIAVLKGHTQPVTQLVWQPLHLNAQPWVATGAKDSSIRVWDGSGKCLKILTSHTAAIGGLRWGGGDAKNPCGLLFSGSRDRLLKVWDPQDGRLLQDLKGHGHWINSVALNTEDVIRVGAFEHPYFDDGPVPTTAAARQQKALQRYRKRVDLVGGERILSGSDDHTLFLWALGSRKPLARMTGHQQVVPFVCFSPDGRFIASASFDKSIRLWDGRSGQYLGVFRGHVASVYMVAWSADARLLVTASKDSTVKLWDVAKRKLVEDLPGHADEVYCVDWSRDGTRVVTGSKDRLVKIWRH